MNEEANAIGPNINRLGEIYCGIMNVVADRLDAIGAIGVARCMATCADMKRPFYAPEDPFCRSREPDDKQWGIDHFYKKLFRIPERLHTATARALPEERTQAMRAFLAQLEREI